MTIHSETVIDDAVAQRIAEINAQRDLEKNPHRRLWMNLLSVVLIIMGCIYLGYWAYIDFSSEGRPQLGALLLVMAATVLFYANTDPVKNNLVKIRKSLGTHWFYDFGEEGITAFYDDGGSDTFPWDFATNWWEEKDYFCLDVTGSPIVVPKSQFNMKQRAALREMLDTHVRIRTDDEVKAELKEKKRQERAEKRKK